MTLTEFLLLAAMGLGAQSPDPTVEVQIDFNGELDACAVGQVVGISSFLAVRSGPGIAYEQRDSLHNGDLVLLCDRSADGQWDGVLYLPKGEDPEDCSLSTQPLGLHPFRGKCHSGWVRSKWITLVAG